jgi:hypothetical protein
MRSVRGIRGVLAIGAPALLAAVVGVGCRSDQAAGQELPARAEPVATIVGDGLLPGDQRLPGGAPTVTTAVPHRPIGTTSSPVPANRTPVTRTPVFFPGVETTITTTGLLAGS